MKFFFKKTIFNKQMRPDYKVKTRQLQDVD